MKKISPKRIGKSEMKSETKSEIKVAILLN